MLQYKYTKYTKSIGLNEKNFATFYKHISQVLRALIVKIYLESKEENIVCLINAVTYFLTNYFG
jgi:hypothetical protein